MNEVERLFVNNVPLRLFSHLFSTKVINFRRRTRRKDFVKFTFKDIFNLKVSLISQDQRQCRI